MIPLPLLEQNFSEIVEPLHPEQAIAEANRCLYCFDAPCIAQCPTGIDVPAFIRAIATGDRTRAASVILDANILGATCARICPTETLCEGACVLGKHQRPVSIGLLQRYAVDDIRSRSLPVLPPLADAPEPGAGRVAVVGSGPAGLSAAATLARLGYGVDVYEAREKAGGLDTYGIVSFRLPPEISAFEVALVEGLGVRIITRTRVGVDIGWGDLRARYQAVVVATGLGRVPKLGIPGEALPGVYDALDFIEMTKTRPLEEIAVGSTVAVIGAGNTAVDAATAARRLGADRVMIVYRRDEASMSAYGYEYAFAKQEGVEYRWWTVPVALSGEGRVTSMECMRTRADGGALTTVPDSTFHIPVDTVIVAIGQEKQGRLWADLGIGETDGTVAVDPETFESRAPGLYVVGDALGLPGEATVVSAVQMGKKVAYAINERLRAQISDTEKG